MNQTPGIGQMDVIINWINTYLNPFGIVATFGGFWYTIKQIRAIKSNQESIFNAINKYQIKECLSLINEAQQNLQLSRQCFQLKNMDSSLQHLSVCRNKLLSTKHRLSSLPTVDFIRIQKILTDISILYDKLLKIKLANSAKFTEARYGDFFELDGLIQQWHEYIGTQIFEEIRQ